jgi:predicted ATP-grasp superfamily ATP-dependent carboligase
MSNQSWVLITDGGGGQDRASLAAVRALSAAGYRTAVAAFGPASLAGASRHAGRWIPVPAAGDPAYPVAIRQAMDAGSFLTVLPSSDVALLALDAPVRHLVDKEQLAGTARAAGFAVPPSATFGSGAELVAAAGSLAYPVVVKAATKGPGSLTAAYRADRPADIHGAANGDGPLVVQPFVFDPMWAVSGVVWNGRVVASVRQRYLRTWPSDCGTASAAVTVEADLALERRLPSLLAPYEGVFQVQFAGRFLIDVNPRIYGSLPLAVAAGANLPGLWCGLIAGDVDVGTVRRGRPGVRYRWIEGDARNLVEAVRRRALAPSAAAKRLRPHPGTAHSTESLGDPGPMVARLGYAVRRAWERSP